MTFNIIDEYVDYLKKSYLELFRILFKNKYRKDEYLPFINKYISVRYYNETLYPQTRDFLKRINKELLYIINKMPNKDNIEHYKNIVAVFGYIVYFDDVNYVTEDMELINSLVEDDIIKIQDKSALQNELKEWYKKYKSSKELFHSTIESNHFYLLEQRLYRKIFSLSLAYNIKISNLYSEYAIDKAYNTGTVNEDKALVTYILTSSLILDNAINLDFSKHYMVDFPSSLFGKDKKRKRLIKIFDNHLAKKMVIIRVTYTDYMSNQKIVNDLINEGYSFGLELDSTYKGNIIELFLFPYILVYNNSEEYEMLMREKDYLKSKIIKL